MPSPTGFRAQVKPTLFEAHAVRQQLEQASHVLIIRLRSLGDSILILPLLEALRAWRPDLQLDLLVETPFTPVFANHPAVREAIPVRPKGSGSQGWNRAAAALEIRKRQYPLVLNLHGGTTAALLTAVSGAAFRVGQQGYRSAWAYNALIPPSSELWQLERLHTVQHSFPSCAGLTCRFRRGRGERFTWRLPLALSYVGGCVGKPSLITSSSNLRDTCDEAVAGREIRPSG